VELGVKSGEGAGLNLDIGRGLVSLTSAFEGVLGVGLFELVLGAGAVFR
jgi:hypothetical protein